jgi:hypothetical protein
VYSGCKWNRIMRLSGVHGANIVIVNRLLLESSKHSG